MWHQIRLFLFLKLEKQHHVITLIGIIYERLVLNTNDVENSMGTSGKTKYLCTKAVGSLDKRVRAHGSSPVIGFILSVK